MQLKCYGYKLYASCMHQILVLYYLSSSYLDSKLSIYSSIILSHPVLRLVHVSLLISNSVQAVIDIVACSCQMLAETSCAAEWTWLLKHVSCLAHLTIARLIKYLAVISDDFYRNTKVIVKNATCQTDLVTYSYHHHSYEHSLLPDPFFWK